MAEVVPYLNPDLSTEERVEDLLSRMTVEEKVGQMLQLDARGNMEPHVIDRLAGSILHASPQHVVDAHALTDKTRLKIPLLIAEDCIHGHSFFLGATIFPTQLGMAASWDPELLEKVGRITAEEASATGIHWTFSPVLCIARDLRWGRVGETFGEDPYLIGVLAEAMMHGYQGDGLSDKTAILATAKHFAGYSETQGGRDATEADLSHRKLRSWFLPPFERVAKAGCATFMLGYQTTDGVPIVINEWLLSDVLRGEWDYPGLLVTDWDNVGRMVWEQHVQPDIEHAAAAAVKAGNDMVMTTPTFFEGALAAIESGKLKESDLDRAVRHILTVKFNLGLFEDKRHPSTDAEVLKTKLGTPEAMEENLRITRRSLVLLENDGVLPLPADAKDKKVTVVGALADDAQNQLGDWAGSSGQADWLPDGQPREMITTILDGIRQEVPETWSVEYVRGADILELHPDPEGETFEDGQPRPPIAEHAPIDPEEIARAVAAAESSDYVVADVGDQIEVVGEALSTATLELMGGQVALLEALEATGKPLIVVLMASKPMVLPAAARNADALIWAASPGMQGGKAIAEILLGKTNPSGRLPISFPVHVGQQPTYYNQVRGQHGHRYADLTQIPAFAFGYGLSFSDVSYEDARLEQDSLSLDDTVVARVTLKNESDLDVIETVQAYVSDLVTSASWADKELKGYTQVTVPAHSEVDVTVEVPVADCSIVNARGERIVEPGAFNLLLGSSSRDEDLEVLPFEVKA